MFTWKPKKPCKETPEKPSKDTQRTIITTVFQDRKKGLYQIIAPPLSLADRYDLIQS